MLPGVRHIPHIEDPEDALGLGWGRVLHPDDALERQHDRAGEVFYVTSTCMLVKHGVFRSLRGWDARLRAFSEDLDLCWRARVAGYNVRLEPEAKARHLMGLATGVRRSPYKPIRYFIRRNRLRTMAKNVAGTRLLALFPFFVFVALIEMVGFIALRQFREIPNIARALGWNLVNIPQTLAERARAKQLKPEEVHGGTFTITNPGPFGSIISVPIIPRGQTGILGFEAIQKRVVANEDDSIGIRNMGFLSMSWDHRTIDGAEAAKFLARLRERIETTDFSADLSHFE